MTLIDSQGANDGSSKPHYLYHYTKFETAIEHILPNMKLLMNSLMNMNDPQENLNYLIQQNYDLCGEYSNQSLFEVHSTVRKQVHLLSFSVDNEFQSGYKLQRMWAQYGQNHKGVCLQIDYNKFVKENKGIINGHQIKDFHVEYAEHRFDANYPIPKYGIKKGEEPILEGRSCKDIIQKAHCNSDFIKRRYFTKNIDWQGESEYRFLALKLKDGLAFSIEKSLEKVILGIDFVKYYLPSIIKLLNENMIYEIIMESDLNFEKVTTLFSLKQYNPM